MNVEKLQEILENHKKWILGSGGNRADLTNADLREANLRYANLVDADLTYANLADANLKDANLVDADLTYANLADANLKDADLRYADLTYANLVDADLKDADLRYADLRYANLKDADLRYADLRYANTQNVIGFKILSIDNIGTYNGKATYIPDYDRVFAGCWIGTLEGFLKKGLEMNKDNEKELKNIKLAYEFFKNNCV